jgi:hypothetical protein
VSAGESVGTVVEARTFSIAAREYIRESPTEGVKNHTPRVEGFGYIRYIPYKKYFTPLTDFTGSR